MLFHGALQQAKNEGTGERGEQLIEKPKIGPYFNPNSEVFNSVEAELLNTILEIFSNEIRQKRSCICIEWLKK